MKKFRFSLGRIRDYKKQLLEREKISLMQLFSQLHFFENRLEELTEVHTDLCVHQLKDMEKGISAYELGVYELKKTSVINERKSIMKQREEIISLIDTQRDTVAALSNEVSGLDKLEESEKQGYMHLTEMENQRTIDEYISFRLTKEKENNKKSK